MEKLEQHISQRVLVALLVLSIALTAFVTYRDILDYYFTASDAFALIETSRIQSPSDVARIFSEPLMNGTFFAQNWKYYRPIANLSYSLDYAIWGLNPFGYHLTDLFLHILVSILIFFFVRGLTGGKSAAAWLSAIVFATHPILVENVPAIARRHDILAAAFMLCSLILFFKNVSRTDRSKLLLLFSLVFCALALGAKEISIILPLLVFSYSMLFVCAEQESLAARAKQGVKDALPYLAIAAVALAWRTYVLKGLGGYLHPPENIKAPGLIETLNGYVLDLFYPVDFLNLLESQRAPFFSLLIFLAVCLVGVYQYVGRGDSSIRSKARATAVFLLIWISLPLFIYLATQTFTHRSMYVPAIPVCIVLSLTLVETIQSLVGQKTPDVPKLSRRMEKTGSAVGVLLFTAVILSLLLYSPLFRTYGEWKDSGKMSAMYLQKLSEIFPRLPGGAVIHAHNLPTHILSYEKEIPRAKSVSYLGPGGISAWLDLNYPDNRAQVILRSTRKYPTCPTRLGLSVEAGEENIVIIKLVPLAF
jgi:hypothetical protein